MARRAVIMDRDGTICEEVGYVNHVDRLRLLDRSAEAIRRAADAGFATVVVTNQAGVARGYFSERMVHDAHEKLTRLLAERGASLDAIYYCPHHPEVGDPPYRKNCDCRKPRPGLLLRARDELGVDLERSFVVGDSSRDLEAGSRVGARTVLVLTGYGRGEWEHRSDRWTVRPDHVAADLLDAVTWILEQDARPAHTRGGAL